MSSANMMDEFNPNSRAKAALAMAIVETASIASGLKTFAQGCYTFEGDSCIILRALDVFKRMEQYVENGFDTTGLKDAVDRALPMISSVDNEYKLDCERAQEAADSSSAIVAKLKAEMQIGIIIFNRRDIAQYKLMLTSSQTPSSHIIKQHLKSKN